MTSDIVSIIALNPPQSRLIEAIFYICIDKRIYFCNLLLLLLLLLSGCTQTSSLPAKTTSSPLNMVSSSSPTTSVLPTRSPLPSATFVPSPSLPSATLAPSPSLPSATFAPSPSLPSATFSPSPSLPSATFTPQLESAFDQNLICLAVFGVSWEPTVEELRYALTQVQQHPDWEAAIGTELAIVDSCEVQLPNGLLNRQRPLAGMVEQPSPWRTVVVVLDEPHAEAILGQENASIVPYEMMILSEHEAVEVTSAVVVRDDFLQTPEFIRSLTSAIHLDPDRLP